MKILCVVPVTVNAYNSNINNSIIKKYPECEIQLGIENFWNRTDNYDIIHLQWPEGLFNWKENVGQNDLNALIDCLNYWKEKSKIIITRHNSSPYLHNNKFYEAIFEKIFLSVDAIIHLDHYSVKEFYKRYPDIQVQHAVIPIGAYTNYQNFLGKKEARKKLGISNKKFVIVVFGSIRSEDEKTLILNGFNNVGIKNKALLINRWLYYHERIKRWMEYVRYYFSLKYYIRSEEVPDDDIQVYLNASDIFFIPRFKALNSSMLTLGFTFGKTVVGPNLGSIGEILNKTGNPTYEPEDIKSVAAAIIKAKKLNEKGKGEENRQYALKYWDLKLIASRHFELYKQVLGYSL